MLNPMESKKNGFGTKKIFAFLTPPPETLKNQNPTNVMKFLLRGEVSKKKNPSKLGPKGTKMIGKA